MLNGKRDQLKQYLLSRKIPTMIYYPLPIHLQNAYRYLGYSEGDFPVSEMLCREVLSLPVCSETDKEQLQYITGTIHDFFKCAG